MELVVLGTGAAYPGPHQASSGYLVKEGETRLLIDCGNGVVSRLQEAGELESLTHLLFSHLHADHMLDIFPLFYSRLYARGKRFPPLPVYMPPGEVERFTRLAEVLRIEPQKLLGRVFHIEQYDAQAGLVIDSLRISFLRTVHPVPAFALRLDSAGHSLVYTADTAPFPELGDFARGCDLLLAEATISQEDFDPEHAIHLTPALAADLATKAGARRLLLTHMWPFYDRQAMLEEGLRIFPDTELAEDLARYSI